MVVQLTDEREGESGTGGREGGMEVAGKVTGLRVHLGHTCRTEPPSVKCRVSQRTDVPERWEVGGSDFPSNTVAGARL